MTEALTRFEAEIVGFIVAALGLDASASDDIGPDSPLYEDGLGLDSIDLLEVSLELSQRYGVSLKSDTVDKQSVFASVRSLATFVESNRSR